MAYDYNNDPTNKFHVLTHISRMGGTFSYYVPFDYCLRIFVSIDVVGRFRKMNMSMERCKTQERIKWKTLLTEWLVQLVNIRKFNWSKREITVRLRQTENNAIFSRKLTLFSQKY